MQGNNEVNLINTIKDIKDFVSKDVKLKQTTIPFNLFNELRENVLVTED